MTPFWSGIQTIPLSANCRSNVCWTVGKRITLFASWRRAGLLAWQAAAACSRKQYQELAHYLEKIKDYPGGTKQAAQLAEDWRARYSRRRAMMEETRGSNQETTGSTGNPPFPRGVTAPRHTCSRRRPYPPSGPPYPPPAAAGCGSGPDSAPPGRYESSGPPPDSP